MRAIQGKGGLSWLTVLEWILSVKDDLVEGYRASHRAPSAVPKQRGNRKWGKAANPQAHPQRPTSSSQTSFLKGSITFQNIVTSWRPDVQTFKPMGHISQLNHNSHGALSHSVFRYLRRYFIHDSFCCIQGHIKNEWFSKVLSLMPGLSPLSPKDAMLVLGSNLQNIKALMSEKCYLCISGNLRKSILQLVTQTEF